MHTMRRHDYVPPVFFFYLFAEPDKAASSFKTRLCTDYCTVCAPCAKTSFQSPHCAPNKDVPTDAHHRGDVLQHSNKAQITSHHTTQHYRMLNWECVAK